MAGSSSRKLAQLAAINGQNLSAHVGANCGALGSNIFQSYAIHADGFKDGGSMYQRLRPCPSRGQSSASFLIPQVGCHPTLSPLTEDLPAALSVRLQNTEHPAQNSHQLCDRNQATEQLYPSVAGQPTMRFSLHSSISAFRPLAGRQPSAARLSCGSLYRLAAEVHPQDLHILSQRRRFSNEDASSRVSAKSSPEDTIHSHRIGDKDEESDRASPQQPVSNGQTLPAVNGPDGDISGQVSQNIYADDGSGDARTGNLVGGSPPPQEAHTAGRPSQSKRHDLAILFTCTVCDTRSGKTMSRATYETGIVIVRCPSCRNLHLIADRLGWFGEPGSIESFLAEKGIEVRKGTEETYEFRLEDLTGWTQGQDST